MTESEDIIGGDDDYFGFIIMGSFDQEKMVQTIESENEEELETNTYKGYTSHLSIEDDMAIVFGKGQHSWAVIRFTYLFE